MFICTADAPVIPAPDSAMVCIIIAASEIPRLEPPYSTGMQIPSQPSFASAEWSLEGKLLVSSVSSQYSSGNFEQTLEIASLTVFWEVVRSGSKACKNSVALV